MLSDLGDFQTATLFTTGFDLHFDVSSLIKKAPTRTEPPSLAHDRTKKRLISAEGKPYLYALGLSDENGRVHKNAQDKFRQINRYIEILSGLTKGKDIRKVVDMGSGKGYLTFALYDYLSTAGHDVSVTGVEFRQDMVDLCNGIARQSNFGGLKFVQGSIARYDTGSVDLLIALHACDTATDDAIAKGIESGAALIVVAPCCHKQIRREMEQSKKENDISFLTRHGIFLERQAEMVTDGLRALILEYFGYSAKVFEFISDSHTPKNVMIVGVRNSKPMMRDPRILDKIEKAKAYFGINRHALEKIIK